MRRSKNSDRECVFRKDEYAALQMTLLALDQMND
jgi:hypothetical protein